MVEGWTHGHLQSRAFSMKHRREARASVGCTLVQHLNYIHTRTNKVEPAGPADLFQSSGAESEVDAHHAD